MSDGIICTNCGEYAGSPIADRIAHLEAQLAAIEEYGTEEINAAVTLRQELAKALVRIDELEEKLGELLEVSKRAVQLSLEYPDFKLYAMEPMGRAIAHAELTGGKDE